MVKRRKYEFKPDRKESNFLHRLYLTHAQRQQLLKWGLYSTICILLLVVQDVIMSQIHFYGATTDLAVCAILLIAILEGQETGGLFSLIAAALYHFAGSAPFPYVIALIPVLAIFCALFRQSIWCRSFGSMIFTAGGAFLLYELGVFAIGLVLGRTILVRFPIFVLTWAYSMAVMVPLYPLCNAIRKIGGEAWKE